MVEVEPLASSFHSPPTGRNVKITAKPPRFANRRDVGLSCDRDLQHLGFPAEAAWGMEVLFPREDAREEKGTVLSSSC